MALSLPSLVPLLATLLSLTPPDPQTLAHLTRHVLPQVAASPIVQAWGEYRQNLINVTESGKLQAEAVKLMDRAGYR